MALEVATYISDLVATNPVGATDTKASLDDHIRLVKSTVKATFPNVSGAVTPTHTELNYVDGVTSAIQTQLDAKAPLASPTLTGTPLAPTATAGTNTTQIATTAFTNAAITAAALAATVPTVGGDAGKVLGSDGSTGAWSSSLKSTVMRFADGTDATKLLAFGVSGFTTATTRTATWPDKDGTVAMTSDILRALTLLATLTPTAAANVDALNTFSSTYDNYLILGQGLLPAANDSLLVRFAAAGTTDAGASNYYSTSVETGTPITSAGSSIGVGGAVLAAGLGLSFVLHVSNANDATNAKALSGKVVHQTNATPGWLFIGAHGAYIATNAASGVRFLWSGGSNFSATGKIRIYGYNNT